MRYPRTCPTSLLYPIAPAVIGRRQKVLPSALFPMSTRMIQTESGSIRLNSEGSVVRNIPASAAAISTSVGPA